MTRHWAFSVGIAGLLLAVFAESLGGSGSTENPRTTEAPVLTECPKVDIPGRTVLLAHESDCTKFYACSNGRKILMECALMDLNGNRLYFNVKLQMCDWPSRSNCNNRNTTAQPPGENTTPEPTEGSGTTIAENSPTTVDTVPTSESSTTKQSTQRPTTEGTGDGNSSDTHIPTECPKTDSPAKTVLLPHELDCTKFYACVHGKKVLMQCALLDLNGHRLYFNAKLQVCDWPNRSGCMNNHTTHASEGTTHPTTGITETTSQQSTTQQTTNSSTQLPTITETSTQKPSTGSNTNPTTDSSSTTENPTQEPSTERTTSSITESPTTTANPTQGSSTESTTSPTTESSRTTENLTQKPSTESTTSPTPKSSTTTENPIQQPSTEPTANPTTESSTTTGNPTEKPSTEPTTSPTTESSTTTENPTEKPSTEPTTSPTTESSTTTDNLTEKPSTEPTTSPITESPTTTGNPIQEPSTEPNTSPTTAWSTTTKDLTEEPTTGPTTSRTTESSTTTENPTQEPSTGSPTNPPTELPTTTEQSTQKPTTESTPQPTTQLPSSPTTPNPFDSCPPSGINNGKSYSHECICEKYYTCSDAGLILHQCPNKKHFNPSTEACDEPENAGCSRLPLTTQITPTSSDPVTMECPPDGNRTLIPHETKCSSFYICDKGQKQLANCVPGLEFNPTLRVCDYPEASGCSKPSSQTRSVIIDDFHLRVSEDIEARHHGQHHHSDDTRGCIGRCLGIDPNEVEQLPHRDCRKFCKCHLRRPHVIECPPDLQYNPVERICDYSVHAGYKGHNHRQ
ncbi:mucin-2 isoform X2 [Fopius arisanus]|uniref:Mucin-2 isoform X2 n=1 Tax=Fopius arisanus TaxID=64838 RepID=A0A9R1STF6_9HYME|nr:PREDICTED: mucin-2-like isoform X2 [Fopius arisanus]